MNSKVLCFQGVKLETRETYAVEYVESLLMNYQKALDFDTTQFVSGKGYHKTLEQRQYQKLEEYLNRLKAYSGHIQICGEQKNSYSKTDHDATFIRIKSDYMGNNQLLPAYNMQAAICDEYIAIIDAKPYAADVKCFVPLIEKF